MSLAQQGYCCFSLMSHILGCSAASNKNVRHPWSFALPTVLCGLLTRPFEQPAHVSHEWWLKPPWSVCFATDEAHTGCYCNPALKSCWSARPDTPTLPVLGIFSFLAASQWASSLLCFRSDGWWGKCAPAAVWERAVAPKLGLSCIFL